MLDAVRSKSCNFNCESCVGQNISICINCFFFKEAIFYRESKKMICE